MTKLIIATMNKRQLKSHKTALAHQIQNIKSDYSGVLKEDIPDEVNAELHDLLTELKMTRELYDNK